MSNLTGNANFFKYLLFLFNFIFVITGIIILSIGIAVQSVYLGYEHFLESKFFSIPALLIAIGIIIFLVAAFGCIAAVRENYCMIMAFSVMLFIVFILELAAGISGYVLRNETYNLVKGSLSSTMPLYKNETYAYYNLWDDVQRKFLCCGISNVTDWELALDGSVPVSCCPMQNGIVDTFTCSSVNSTSKPFDAGCLDKFGYFIRAHAISLGAAGISLAVIQLAGVFIACFIAHKIKSQQGLGSM